MDMESGAIAVALSSLPLCLVACTDGSAVDVA